MKKMYIILIAALIIAGVWYAYSLWQKQQSRALNYPGDKVTVSYNLDDLADIKVPQSFEQNTKFTLVNFYGLQPIKDKFVYSFYLKRAEFNDWGGYRQNPVILSLTVYNPQAPFDDWNYYIDNMQTGDSSGINGNTSIQTAETLRKTDMVELDKLKFVSGYTTSHPDMTLLVQSFQNGSQKYRLGLLYWKGYLTDDAANKLLNDTVSTIAIKDSLNSRVKVIEGEFYKRYPEKRT